MERGGATYIVTNRPNGVLYVGMTSELIIRTWKHKTRFYPNSFSARYNLHHLVYYELFPTIVEAIAREQQLKAGSRKKKIALIEAFNPTWKDLYDDLLATW